MGNPARRKALPPINATMKFRAAIRLVNTAHGQKMIMADRLADELGRKRRSVLTWQTLYRQHGSEGILHSRADRGVHRVYSEAQFDLVIKASRRIHVPGDLAREWRDLSLPGCKETFRVWIRRIKKYGYIEIPEQREAISA